MADVAILVVHAGQGHFETGMRVPDDYPGGTSAPETQLYIVIVIVIAIVVFIFICMHSLTIVMHRDSHAPDSGQATRHVEGDCGRQRHGQLRCQLQPTPLPCMSSLPHPLL
jgi:hypothetical protein